MRLRTNRGKDFKMRLYLNCVTALLFAVIATVSIMAVGTTAKAEDEKPANKWVTVNGAKYWYKKDGSKAIGSCKIKGKWYVFGKTGKLLKSKKKKSFYKVKGELYYVNKSGRPLPGWKYIKKKVYFVGVSGKCARSTTVDGVKFNKKARARNTNQGRSKILARKFIRKHTKKSWSKRKKFRTCFRYIMSHTKFKGSWRPKGFYKGNWQYNAAVHMFRHKLRGNCYGIASAVAAVGNELGYDPVVLLIDGGGHAFVKAKGRYYDNMYGAKFAAKSRKSYKAIQRFRFHDGKRWPKKKSASKRKHSSKKGSHKKASQNRHLKKNTSAKKRVGSVKINGKYYIYKANGKLCKPKKTKVVTIKGKRYRVKRNGRAAPGWSRNRKYLFGETGEMYTGTVYHKEKLFAFGEKGKSKGRYNKARTKKLRKAAVYAGPMIPLYDLMGSPLKTSYTDSCYGEADPATGEYPKWKDGKLTYAHVFIHTVKAPSGTELFMYAESR